MKKESHVLVIFPHPDDEAFGVSGTMSKHVDHGTPVTYACLTFGDMGRSLGYPPFATRESLHAIRKKEVEESARLMGVKDLRLLGFRDKTLEFEEPHVLKDVVTRLIDELNPSLIITFYPGYSVHPDHEATADGVIRAVKELEPHKRPKLNLVAFAENTLEDLGEPDIIINIKNYSDLKHRVMQAHKSQTGQLLEDLANNANHSQKEEYNERLKYEQFYSYNVK